MPIIRLISTGLPDLLPKQERSKGPHVSPILYDLAIRMGLLNPQDDEHKESESNTNRMKLGLALEWAFIQQLERDYPGEYFVPGELEKDGIYGHPDLVYSPFDVLGSKGERATEAVLEFKLTWRSSHSDFPAQLGQIAPALHPIHGDKFWKDRAQLAAYCHILDIPFGQLIIGHIRGDYRGIDVDCNQWLMEFTERELQNNWGMILRHRDRMESEGVEWEAA